jgi:hypothetical protein
MKMEFPFYAMTFDGAKVECWEWNPDTEQWVDSEGGRHDPDNLHTVTPPFDDHPPTFLELLSPILATSLDGRLVTLRGFRPYVPDWETGEGENHPVVNFPRPLLLQRERSLDAPWAS